MNGRRLMVAMIVATLVVGGCASAATTPAAPALSAPDSSASADPSPNASHGDPWGEDLDQLDQNVRARHPDPFANTPEATWIAKLDELRATLPAMSPDEQLVGMAGLVGLLDTHSWLDAPVNVYRLAVYPFADGWFVIRDYDDVTLVGARLVSINGHPIEEVEAAMRPLVAADNESGELDGLQVPMITVEYLHGLGIVDDPAKPAFVFERPDGTQVTVQPDWTDIDGWYNQFYGGLQGNAPEAVKRRDEPAWGSLDEATKTFIFSYNDYTENDTQPVIAAMKAALDDGSADRVIIDMRYIRGGAGNLAGLLMEAARDDPRINRPGGLIVMTGRENVSAGTIVATFMDTETQGTLIGEMTPARADNFLCECAEVELVNSGLTVGLPTVRAGNGDLRLSVEPDIPFALTSTAFFAGQDPALDLALALPKDGSAP